MYNLYTLPGILDFILHPAIASIASMCYTYNTLLQLLKNNSSFYLVIWRNNKKQQNQFFYHCVQLKICPSYHLLSYWVRLRVETSSSMTLSKTQMKVVLSVHVEPTNTIRFATRLVSLCFVLCFQRGARNHFCISLPIKYIASL